MSELIKLNPFHLGFGLMRLPKLESGEIDLEQVKEMADMFLSAGGTYFDTAYVYDGGGSEDAFREAVARRYPRSAYTLATKLHAAAASCRDEESAKGQLFTSLKRTGAGYVDFYLLHAIQRSNVDKYGAYGLWDFVRRQKDKGLIRHWGFSFHADPDLLERLLDENPDAEFVQLQINYADWENPGVASRRNWEICRERGKPVVIMEPVKGGVLANPIPAVKEALDGAGKGYSYAGWALRYAASVENVLAVLSGMSDTSQMRDNLGTMAGFSPLDEEEKAAIRRAQRALDADKSIACTACHYCTEGCPMRIPIPEIFNVINRKRGSARFRTVREYNIVTQGRGRAAQCVQCGQCESACPQHLPIIRLLRESAELEEET